MLVTRYLFKNLLVVTLFVAMTLTLVIWLTQSLKLLEFVANSDAPPSLFLKLVIVTLPNFLETILPISIVTAVFFTYNKLIMDNELIVLRASGVDQYALARPAVTLAVIISLVVMALSTQVSPAAAGQLQALRVAVKTQYSAFLLREGVFNTFGSDLTVYLRARDDNGDMAGLMIYDARDKKRPPVTITAKKGQVIMENDVPNIVVFDGMRQQMDPASGVTTKLYFSRYTIEIKGLTGAEEKRWRNADERTMGELFAPDMSNPRDAANRDLFLAEAARRIVSPWDSLSFTLIALATILLGPFNRRGQNKRVLFGALLVALLQTLNLAFVNLAKKHLGFVPLICLNTGLPVLAGFYFLHFRGEQWLMSLLRLWNARSFKGGTA